MRQNRIFFSNVASPPPGWYTKRSNCGIFRVTPQLYYMVPALVHEFAEAPVRCIVWQNARSVFIGLVVVMICVLVFAPVVTAGIYFIHTVSGQLQHTASETVSMYLNEFTDRTDRMMETLRDGVYYLTSDSAAQQMMSSSKPLTQIQILQELELQRLRPRISRSAIRSTPMWSAPST